MAHVLAFAQHFTRCRVRGRRRCTGNRNCQQDEEPSGPSPCNHVRLPEEELQFRYRAQPSGRRGAYDAIDYARL